MDNKFIVLSGVASGLLLLGLLYFFMSGDEEPAPVPVEEPDNIVTQPVPVPVPPPVVTTVEPEPEPVAEEPLPGLEPVPLPPEPEPVVLPSLNNSDSFVNTQISEMANADAISRLLANSQIIRKFVVLVDGMSRGDVPDRDLPVMPPQTSLTVNAQGEEFYRLDPASYTRFNLLVNTFAAIDSEQAVARFRLLEPLFETAYAELGYPGRSFDTALQQAISNILDAQVEGGTILLTQPSVNYHFADPRLENLSDLEKLMIRMGPENAGKVQQKVREIADLLED